MGWVRKALDACEDGEITLDELAAQVERGAAAGAFESTGPRTEHELDDGPGVINEDSFDEIAGADLDIEEYRALYDALLRGYGVE